MCRRRIWSITRRSVGFIAAIFLLAVAALAGLIIFGTASQPPAMTSVSDPMRLIDFSDLPVLQHFNARDGRSLSYRLYCGAEKDVVVLIHGSSGESSGMHALARALNSAGNTVYVPDLRGHGHDGKPGDIGRIGQLDDDLADLVGIIHTPYPHADLILAGHSSGAGFVLRIAEGPVGGSFNRFILLSPALAYGTETNRPNAGGWVAPYTGRIIGLKILNKIGIGWFNGLPILAFAIDPHASVPLDATYSYRMQANFSAPHDAITCLAGVRQPLAVLVGSKDEIMYAERFGPLIHAVRVDVPVTLVPNVDHMGMVTDARGLAAVVAATK